MTTKARAAGADQIGGAHGAGRRRRLLTALTTLAVVASTATTALSAPGVGSGAIDDTRCVVEPTTSTGNQSGVAAVAVGEQVRLGTEVDLPAGVVYQDILANPDGSTYVSTWLGAGPSGGAELIADLATLTLTIDGTSQPLLPGTEPSPAGFVLDSSGATPRVYFPGDPAVQADPTGTAAPSYTVPNGGQTFRLTYLATVPDLDPGQVTPAVTCQAAISYGEANAAVDERQASVAVLGLEVLVAKTASLPVLAPSTTLTYSVEVSVPAFDGSGELRNGSAFDIAVTDVLPAGLDYVAGSASHGGAVTDGVLSWIISEIAAGESITLTYDLAVPADAEPGATYTNDATAVVTSLPGVIAGERTSEASDGVTRMNGAEAPGITKSSNVVFAGAGQVVTFQVGLTWPAGSTWHDVTITDLLPDGFTLVSAGSFTCAPVACPALATLAPHVSPAGTTRLGSFVEQVGPFGADQAWTWTYTARMTGSFAGGAAVAVGTVLDNLAEVRFNLIPRLGGAVPNPARLNEYDGLVGDVAPVEFDRPVIAIDKAPPTPSTVDPSATGFTYTVTLSNSGGVDATNVTFTDPGPASSGFPLGAIQAASVTGATYAAATGTFTVALVPDGETRTVTYAVIGSAANPVAVDGDFDNTATVTGYRDPANNIYTSGVADLATVTVLQPDVTVVKERLSASPIAGTDGETITYRITVTNVGDATAYNIAGTDVLDFDGTLVPGACTGGMTISAAGAVALAQLAPDADASCTYTVELDGDQPEGPLDNTVTITWRNGFGQTGEFTPETGVVPWTSSDDATTTVVHPQLALQKGPEVNTPGNVIVNGQTGTYTVTITNVGQVTARDVVLSDPLPAGLTLEATPGVDTTPPGIANSVSGTAGAAAFTITFPALAPGEAAQVTILVRHDGVEPADEVLVNTATLTADGIPSPLTNPGALVWVPNIVLPTVTKSVTPDSAGIGELVTWTVTATVTENIVDVFDVAFVDTLPRGTTLGSYGTVTCVSGPLCATVPSPTLLAPALQTTGETRIGWFVGDVPANTDPTTYTFAFTSTIAAQYSGTGTPPAGTQVTDTFLVNRVQPWLTITEARDTYEDGSLPDLTAGSLLTQFERRGAVAAEAVRAVTPRVIVNKQITNLGAPLLWQNDNGSGRGWMADAGDTIGYQLTIENIGGATAYDVDVSDSMGQPATGTSLLRDVQITGLPAGVTVVDGWTLADPDVVLRVDELASGDVRTVTYTGTVAPSDELVPGFGADNRDVALIRNTVEVPEFRSGPGGGGLLFEDTFTTGIEAYVFTPSPYIPAASACVGSSTAPSGTTGTFSVNTRNGAPPFGETTGTLLTTGYPIDPTVGVAYDTTLTVVLSPNIRYVPGTATVNAATAPDPAVTVDVATSVQTLVFDLGNVPQNQNRNVAFGVRTIAHGVQGGMAATLRANDATGSPSRGTSVPGATYVYQDTEGRGCASAQPLTIRKFPDLSSQYGGKKQFKVGEEIVWSGSVFGAGAPYHDGEFLDTMPAGIDYTAGSAEFRVTPMSGPIAIASVANGNLTEEITPLPDGRTLLRFTSPAFAVFRSISYSMDSVVGADAIIGSTATNVINLITSDGIVGNCSDPSIAVCDNGQVQIISSATPTITKSVDHAAGPWGDTFAYTVDVTLPGNVQYFDAFIGDRGDFPRTLDPDGTPFANATIECIVGCPLGDPAPVTLPVWTFDDPDPADPDELARAWFLGDLASQIDARTYRITYQQTFADPAEYEAEFGEPPSNDQHVNEAVVGWSDSNVIGVPANTPASSRQFAINSPNRGLDDAEIDLVTPELSVEKVCQALGGRDDPATSSSFGGEPPGAVPNFRCLLTVTNTTDPELSVTVVDPVFVDTVPTVSNPGNRPVTTQLIAWESDELLVELEPTEVPGSPLNPPAVTALRVSALDLELAPGESVSVAVDLRLTAAPAFWSNAALTAERSRNTVAVESFSDGGGNTYESDATDGWDLVITKPDLTVSQRAFAPGEYEASLADPTACLAYGDHNNQIVAVRISLPLGGMDFSRCSNLVHARLHGGTPGGDYARAYAGYGLGAPDVVLGSRDEVTWAVDVAAVSPEASSTVSVTDQIPYGFEYVPGSARLAHWSEAGTAHTPVADPVIGASPGVTCTEHNSGQLGANMSFPNYLPPPGVQLLLTTSGNYGQAPWTPLTWTFANGGSGATGAFWDDALTYLNGANRDAAGAVPAGAPFDRLVRIVFDVRPRGEFDECLQRPYRANSFRSQVSATATHSRGTVSGQGLGWLVGVELARIEKGPDGATSPDGATATYDLDVTITDPTRLHDVNGGVANTQVNAPTLCSASPPLPATPLRTPWIGLGDLDRNGSQYIAMNTATQYGTDFRTDLVVTDTLVDDGLYVPGSASFDMRDPWGRPFAGHLASEDIEVVTVGGRQASRVTWTFDSYPSPFNWTTGPVAAFPCETTRTAYFTFPSTMTITVPLEIPDGTPDGTTYPNSAQVTSNHYSGGSVVRSQGDTDTALITARNPQPPPPTTKTAVPDQVAPGQAFQWIVEADLQADAPWFDLGWTDELPANMELLGYGTPSCVLTGTATPCSGPALVPDVLEPVDNDDGSTTLGWFLGDVDGSSVARTVRMPIDVRFVGPEVAGDLLTNVVTGYSNDDDLVDTIVAPADPDDFFFPGEPVAGIATVVEPDLSVTKTVTNGPGPFQAGSIVTYEVVVTNNGGATAFDVPVSDTPDAFLTAVATASPFRSKGWTELDPRVEWFLPSLGAGQSVTFDLSGVVASDYVENGIRQLTNTATVTGYTSTPVSDEDGREYPAEQAAVTVALVAQNLTVAKYAGAECEDPAQTFVPGDPVEWCVVVANTGDAPAHNVTLTDLLPPGWTFDPGSAEVDGDPVEPAVSTTASDTQRLVWELGAVGPDTEHVITYSTIGGEGQEIVTNTAITDSTLEDGTPLPNAPDGFRSRGEAQAAPLGAGLQLSKLPDQQRFECDRVEGCPVTWQIVVVNADELDLAGASVTDFLPAGLSYESSVEADGWEAAVVGPEGSGPSATTPIIWTNSGAFASGEVATFELTALVPGDTDEREYLNHAVASANGVPQIENQALAAAFATASLGNRVWHDVDADGRQDAGEPGIGGVPVQLFDGDGAGGALAAVSAAAVDGPPLATTVTDPDGLYLFANLDPGNYVVRFLAPAGWLASPAHVGADNTDSDADADGWTPAIALASGTDDPTWDAGLYQPPPPPPPPPPTTPPPGSTPVPPTAPGAVGGSGQTALPVTGANVDVHGLVAVASITLGALMLLVSARRRRGLGHHTP